MVTVSITFTVIKIIAKEDVTDYAYVAVDVINFSKMTITGTFVTVNSAYSQSCTVNVGLASYITGEQSVGYTKIGISDEETHTIDNVNYDISGLTGVYYFRGCHSNPTALSTNIQTGTLTLTKVEFL